MEQNTTEMIRCVYCLGDFSKAEITVDHVIARSWFPVIPIGVDLWTAPSCGPCNNKKSKIEKKVLERAALCLNPKEVRYRNIIEKALRAYNPHVAKSERDAEHRYRNWQVLEAEMVENLDPNEPGAVPGFVENYDHEAKSGTAIMLDGKIVSDLTEMWIRGVHYCELNRYISVDAKILVHSWRDEVADERMGPLFEQAASWGMKRRVAKGPDVEVMFIDAQDENKSVILYSFNIWNGFRTYGSVIEIDMKS